MNQIERLEYLVEYLLEERKETISSYLDMDLKDLFRSLLNIRPAKEISSNFLKIQDEYLIEELYKKHITSLSDIEESYKGIYLWQGDITTLKVDGIVNAANKYLEGCFIPCHNCIDNVIHSAAGVQLRLDCNNIIKKQGYLEKTGDAKITSAYNLPSKYVLHTVGPIITSEVEKKDIELLASCYTTCLDLAIKNNLSSIAFCCISTGEFHFPNKLAAEIAIDTVSHYLKNNEYKIKVVFNVFKERDYKIYQRLLRQNKKG